MPAAARKAGLPSQPHHTASTKYTAPQGKRNTPPPPRRDETTSGMPEEKPSGLSIPTSTFSLAIIGGVLVGLVTGPFGPIGAVIGFVGGGVAGHFVDSHDKRRISTGK